MIVYWCNIDVNDNESTMTGLRRLPPYQVKNLLDGKYNVRETNAPGETYFRCPAHIDHLKNLFAVPAAYDCDLIIDKQPDQPEFATSTFAKSNHDFDRIFLIRSIKNRLFSINQTTLFITESDDVEMSQMPAYLEDNDFINNAVIIPGTFNVGKWPRVLECAFHLKKDRMFIREGEPLYYLKFHTNEKIVFKEFLYTPKMKEYAVNLLASRNFKSKKTKLQFFYDIVARKGKFKQRMIEEAKANVIGE